MRDLTERVRRALADKYAIERELGHGGAAVVYVAEDLKHERRVAVKVMRPDLAATLGPDRFLREIKIAAKLTHPNILSVHDSGEAEGFLYYVMPVVEGGSLRTRLSNDYRLPVHEVVRLLHDILDALQFAHGRGVVHRDIKPDNVMLSGRHALVTDFGVAKALTEAADHTSDTRGVALGTPAYMAPEQAGADPNIDHRADLYSVGALAYEMLAGRPPFQDDSPQRVLAAQVTRAPAPVTDHRPDVPPALADLVMRLLQKQPEDRFQTAEDVLGAVGSDVTPSSGSHPITTLSLDAVSRGKWVRRSFALLTVVVLVFAVGQIGRGFGAGDGAARPMLAVLPFDNIGPADDAAFAHGIAGAISARLSTLGGVGVIAQSSAMQYQGSGKTAQQIGQELDVDYILEGTIQRERPSDPSSRLRVTPQLVRVNDNTQLWASIYDEDMTEVFMVQSDIAERVARALDVTLAEPERANLADAPTLNLAAYDAYLRGHDYLERARGSGNANARRIAIDMLEEAIALDSGFALAYAELSTAHLWMYRNFVDPSEDRLATAKAAADSAVSLQPNLPQGHLALGQYYYWKPDPQNLLALDEFAQVVQREPNNSYVRTLMANLQAASGNWDEALENSVLATDLDPREPQWAADAGRLHLLARRYAEAERYLARALDLAPDLAPALRDRIALPIRRDGDTAAASRAVTEMLDLVTTGEVALALIDIAPMLVRAGGYDSLFEQLTPGSLSGPLPFDYYLARGEYFRLRGRNSEAVAYYDSLLTRLDRLPEDRVVEPRVEMLYAQAFVGVGRTDNALLRAERIERLLAESNDALLAADMEKVLVDVYLAAGEYERAVGRIEHLLAVPSLMTKPYLRASTLPSGLTDLSRFRLLVDNQT